SEFEFNAPSHLVCPNLEVSVSQKFRTFKYQLRQNYFRIARGKAQIEAAIQDGLDPYEWKRKEQILANVPMGVTPSNWIAFVENEFKEGVRENHENKSEKKKCRIPHTLGRHTYANKCDLLICFIHSILLLAEEEGMLTEDREYAWMKVHEKSDGTIHPSAIEKYEQVKASYEKRKEKGTNCSYYFGFDGLVDVFGPDNGKRSLRGFSSRVFAKCAKKAFLTATLRDSTVNKCNSPVIGLKKVMAQKISSDHLTSEETLLNDSYTPNSDFTPEFIPENHVFTSNLNPMSEPQPLDNSGYEQSSYQNVNLLDRNGKVVAAGYVVTGLEGEVCHHRIVQNNESKVRIECVYDDAAPIWDPPQGDDYYKLSSYVGGGWVVWNKKRLQFTN
ncbi:hypothetical protein MKX03_028628, partial [Papaver bracteatum]